MANKHMTTFLMVSDADFFPGLLATVASVQRFHPNDRIVVVDNLVQKKGLTTAQLQAMMNLGVTVIPATDLALRNRKLAAWELKAYAAEFLSSDTELLVGIDVDAVLCGPIHDLLGRAWWEGVFLGGKDGTGADYGEAYKLYGIATPSRNCDYMSTSLYVCRTLAPNKVALSRWAECCAQAEFGGTGPYPGHGDQGVLNAILFSMKSQVSVKVLENHLWSQHHVYWQAPLSIKNGGLFNLTVKSPQRAIHCGGSIKFWRKDHESMIAKHPHTRVNYAWYLCCLRKGFMDSGLSLSTLIGENHHLEEAMARYNELMGEFTDL